MHRKISSMDQIDFHALDDTQKKFMLEVAMSVKLVGTCNQAASNR